MQLVTVIRQKLGYKLHQNNRTTVASNKTRVMTKVKETNMDTHVYGDLHFA